MSDQNSTCVADPADYTSDLSGVETHRLTSLYQPPEFVKRASREQLYAGVDSLPPHVFADPTLRQYPCHNAAATWMSALFFGDHAQAGGVKQATAQKRIMDAAEFFHIKPAVASLWEKMAADAGNELCRLPDSDFALVWATETGKERHYPLRNAVEVKMAADWFAKFRDEFVYADRQMLAERILDKADEYGAGLPDRSALEKVAGRGYCAAATLTGALEKRAGLVSRSYPEYAQKLRELIPTLQTNPAHAREHETRRKLAGVLDQFDRCTHLTRLYGDGLERPEEVLFQVAEKAAATFTQEHVATTTGCVYEKAALGELKLDDVRDWMGDEFAEAVSLGGLYVDLEKLATVLGTLPMGDAATFDRLAQECGIQPFAVEKAAEGYGISPEEIEELAEVYQQRQAGTPELVAGSPLVL